MKTTFEEMGGTYRQEGDYLLPNIAVPHEMKKRRIGKYGLKHIFSLQKLLGIWGHEMTVMEQKRKSQCC